MGAPEGFTQKQPPSMSSTPSAGKLSGGGFLQVETTWRCVQPLPATLVPFTSFEGGAAAQLLDRSLDHQGSCSLTHASFPPTTVNRFSSCVRARRPTKEMAFLSSRSRLSAFECQQLNYPVTTEYAELIFVRHNTWFSKTKGNSGERIQAWTCDSDSMRQDRRMS